MRNHENKNIKYKPKSIAIGSVFSETENVVVVVPVHWNNGTFKNCCTETGLVVWKLGLRSGISFISIPLMICQLLKLWATQRTLLAYTRGTEG